jgi:tight adherence protein C
MASSVCIGIAAVTFAAVLLMLVLSPRHDPLADRLQDIVTDGRPPPPPDPRRVSVVQNPVDRLTERRVQAEEKKRALRERMVQSGFYGAAASSLFIFVRLLLILGSSALGFLISGVTQLPPIPGLLAGVACGIAATIAPGIWLDILKRKRQTQIRRSLPDALDVLVICLQGGLSVMSAMSRVARELSVAHPLLAVELKVAERQMQMGQSAGEAVRGIADRFDLEELRGMASVLIQAERIGSSVASALDVFAETMRLKRSQRAEELAHKAAVKMLFPTLLCIFPAIFVVILGPAGIQVYEVMIKGVMQNVGH